MTIRIITAAITLATAFASPSVALEAMRCNVQTKPGLFQPVLRIKSQDKIQDIRMGTEGLSRRIFYRDRDVLSFIAAKFDLPPSQMPHSVSSMCGSVDDGQGFQGGTGTGPAVVASPPEPEIETDPEETAGVFEETDGFAR